MTSQATEAKVGPAIEKAQLEAVDVSLEAVVAAITKADPDWVEGLPRVKPEKMNTTEVAPKSTSLNTVIWGLKVGWEILREIPNTEPIRRLLAPSRCKVIICFKSIGSSMLAMSLYLCIATR